MASQENGFGSAFGELRSLLHAPLRKWPTVCGMMSFDCDGDGDPWRQQIWQCIRALFEAWPDEYVSECIPYLSNFSDIWEFPLTAVYSLEELEQAATIAPFGLFSLVAQEAEVFLPHLARSPHLARLGALEVRDYSDGWMHEEEGGAEVFTKLLASPLLTNLLHLEIWDTIVDLGTLELLTTSSSFSQVLQISFRSCSLGFGDGSWLMEEAIVRLSKAKNWKGLRGLLVGSHPLNAAEVKLIVEAPWFEPLEFLGLLWNGLHTQDIAPLLTSPRSGRLEGLNLSGNPLGAEVIGDLIRATGLEGLRGLYLDDVDIPDGSVEMLAASPWLARLTELTMQVSSTATAALVDSPHLSEPLRRRFS